MARQGAEFGKRAWREAPRKSATQERRSGGGIWLAALVAILAFAAVFAARTLRPAHVAATDAISDAPPPSAVPGEAASAADASSPYPFLKGRWVTSHASCKSTDNYIVFGEHGYDAFAHERQWTSHGLGYGSYWQKGSLLMVRNPGNTRAAIFVFKRLETGEIAFFTIAFDADPDYDRYAQPDPDAPRGSDLVPQFKSVSHDLRSAGPVYDPNEDWRRLFRVYLGTLKRCVEPS